jgi:predicted phosphodiesterase
MKKLIYTFCLFYFSTHNLALSQSFGVIGDAGYWNSYSKQVRDSIQKSGVNKLILPGDNLYDTSLNYEDVWSPWTDVDLRFSVVSLGNHYKDIATELAFFNMPGKFYIKDFTDVRFIVLDSETEDVLDQQKSFLIDSLVNSNKKFNIIVFHHPMATISYRHGWRERENFHLALRPILNKYSNKINLIINGHDHIASLFTYNEIPVIVSGAVFESRPAPPFNYVQDGGALVQTKWVNKEGHYWVRLDFESDQELIKVQFIRTDIAEISCSLVIKKKNIYRHRSCR